MRGILLFLLLVLFIAGCALDPDYDQPPLDAPKDWRLIDHESRDLTDRDGGLSREVHLTHLVCWPGCPSTGGGPEAALPAPIPC